MQFTTALLALLASSGIVAAAPGSSPGGYNSGYGQCKKFEYSSTCSAVYTTKTQTTSYPYTTTISTTVYKPSTYTKTEESTYYETVTKTKVVTLSKTETESKTIPYKTSSYTTICQTKPVWYWTHSVSEYTATDYYPSTNVQTKTLKEVSEVPQTYTTSTPCPSWIVSTGSKTVVTTITKPFADCLFDFIITVLDQADRIFDFIIINIDEADRIFDFIIININEADRIFDFIVININEADRIFDFIIININEADRIFDFIIININEANRIFYLFIHNEANRLLDHIFVEQQEQKQ